MAIWRVAVNIPTYVYIECDLESDARFEGVAKINGRLIDGKVKAGTHTVTECGIIGTEWEDLNYD